MPPKIPSAVAMSKSPRPREAEASPDLLMKVRQIVRVGLHRHPPLVQMQHVVHQLAGTAAGTTTVVAGTAAVTGDAGMATTGTTTATAAGTADKF